MHGFEYYENKFINCSRKIKDTNKNEALIDWLEQDKEEYEKRFNVDLFFTYPPVPLDGNPDPMWSDFNQKFIGEDKIRVLNEWVRRSSSEDSSLSQADIASRHLLNIIKRYRTALKNNYPMMLNKLNKRE